MRTPQDKMIQSMIDGLSDSRTNATLTMNEVLNEADRNDNLHASLWGMIVAYLYNRAARWALQITHTPNQEHVAEMSYDIVKSVLEPNYGEHASGGLVVSGRGLDPPEIRTPNIM